MSNPSAPVFPTRLAIIRMAIPIILANAAVPLLGLVDTAVMGHSGTAADLGAIALGSLVFSFIYWAFGFLRMSTSGFVAQASGAGDVLEVRRVFLRAGIMGVGIGVCLLALQYPISRLALSLLDGSAAVEQGVKDYFSIRIWGAPAALAIYAVTGLLIGLGHTRRLLWLQLWLNGVNLLLDVWLVMVWDWGVRGIAWGTLIAEWSSALLGLWMLLGIFRSQVGIPDPASVWRGLWAGDVLLKTLKTNADIFWRTLFMLAGFAWFANQGARFGDTVLAANHILLQFISFAAFFLDGYAFVVESLAGRAIGARQRAQFDHVLKRSTEVAAVTAVLLATGVLLLGSSLVDALTAIPAVNRQTVALLPYAALYIALSFAAFQLDGVFIGATRSREMRNASFFSLLLFLALAWALVPLWGNPGLWTAFIAYVVARAVALGLYLPGLRAGIR